MHFHPTASAVNVPAPFCAVPDSIQASLSTCLAVSTQGVVFCNSSCKDLPRLPTIHPHFHSSRPRCWTLLTSEGKGDLFFLPPPWFRDISRCTKGSRPELFSVLQTEDRLQRTRKIPHNYAEKRQSARTIMYLRIFFSETCWLFTTVCVSLGQLLKCKD